MKINTAISPEVGLTAPAEELAGLLRLVAGELPELHLGARYQARVLETTQGQALVDLAGAQVVLDAADLSAGSNLTVQVAALAPRPVFSLQPQATEGSPLPAFQPGQELIVQLLQHLPEGRLLLAVQGTQVEAEAPPGLPVGLTLPVRVEQAGAQVVLRILDHSSSLQQEATQLLRVNLPQFVPAGDSLGRLQGALARQPATVLPASVGGLQRFLQELTPTGQPLTAERLAAYVRDGGLGYETKLVRAFGQGPTALARIAGSDLKGLLLQAARDLETAGKARVAVSPPELRPLSSGGESARGASAPPSIKQEIIATRAVLPTAETTPGPDGKSAQGASAPPTIKQEVIATRAVLHTSETTPGPDAGAPRLADALAGHLGHIETQQALNLLARLHGEPYRLQVPFATAQGLATALIAVEPDHSGTEGAEDRERGYNLLFHLDLTGLGPTKIDAHLTEKTLRAIFYAGKSETVALLQQELPTFRERLEALGYTEILLAARPLARLTTEKRQQFAALAGGVPGQVRLVDVRA